MRKNHQLSQKASIQFFLSEALLNKRKATDNSLSGDRKEDRRCEKNKTDNSV